MVDLSGSIDCCVHGDRCFIVLVAFIWPWRSRKSEQLEPMDTPELFFLAPCSVEEARTGCRLLPPEYSSSSDGTLRPTRVCVQHVFWIGEDAFHRLIEDASDISGTRWNASLPSS